MQNKTELMEVDPGQIFHTYDKWECYQAGFYENKPIKRDDEQCKAAYLHILGNGDAFRGAIAKVFERWPNSCEQYLTNPNFNRIAWLGQAAVCIETAVPSQYCGGWRLLTESQQEAADEIALECLNQWLADNQRPAVTMRKAKGRK